MKDLSMIVMDKLEKAKKAINLVLFSLDSIQPFNPDYDYSPKESEPYDALSDRFSRAIEVVLKFFRSYELWLNAENSYNLRDLLNNMQKVNMITSVNLWIEMREVRNRIAHDYLFDGISNILDKIIKEYSIEFRALSVKLSHLNFD